MRILTWVAWTSVGLAVILLFLGVLAQGFQVRMLPLAHNISYFISASSFLLLSIAIGVLNQNCCDDCCKKDDEK